MDESMKVDNSRTLHQIIEDVLKETVKDISQTDLYEIIKTAVWKPDKDNKSVQRFISRMRAVIDIPVKKLTPNGS